MKATDAVQGVSRLFLDTAPVVYYIENVPGFVEKVRPIFDAIDQGQLVAVVSPITVSECLVLPLRRGLSAVQQTYMRILLGGENTVFTAIDDACAFQAADIRARYNISLLDAMQFAVALREGCQALLTNDKILRRVAEVRVIVVDELEP